MLKRILGFSIAEGLSGLLWSDPARIFLWIPLAGIITLAFGTMTGGDMPWLLVWVCVVAVCAMTAVALFAVVHLRQATSAQHKVQVTEINGQAKYDIENGVLRGAVSYLLLMENRSHYPITLRLTSSNNQVADRIESGMILNSGGVMAPLTTSTFQFRPIDVTGLDPAGFIGQLDATFMYGTGRLKYDLRVRRTVVFTEFTADRFNVRFAHTGEEVEPNRQDITLQQKYQPA